MTSKPSRPFANNPAPIPRLYKLSLTQNQPKPSNSDNSSTSTIWQRFINKRPSEPQPPLFSQGVQKSNQGDSKREIPQPISKPESLPQTAIHKRTISLTSEFSESQTNQSNDALRKPTHKRILTNTGIFQPEVNGLLIYEQLQSTTQSNNVLCPEGKFAESGPSKLSSDQKQAEKSHFKISLASLQKKNLYQPQVNSQVKQSSGFNKDISFLKKPLAQKILPLALTKQIPENLKVKQKEKPSGVSFLNKELEGPKLSLKYNSKAVVQKNEGKILSRPLPDFYIRKAQFYRENFQKQANSSLAENIKISSKHIELPNKNDQIASKSPAEDPTPFIPALGHHIKNLSEQFEVEPNKCLPILYGRQEKLPRPFSRSQNQAFYKSPNILAEPQKLKFEINEINQKSEIPSTEKNETSNKQKVTPKILQLEIAELPNPLKIDQAIETELSNKPQLSMINSKVFAKQGPNHRKNAQSMPQNDLLGLAKNMALQMPIDLYQRNNAVSMTPNVSHPNSPLNKIGKKTKIDFCINEEFIEEITSPNSQSQSMPSKTAFLPFKNPEKNLASDKNIPSFSQTFAQGMGNINIGLPGRAFGSPGSYESSQPNSFRELPSDCPSPRQILGQLPRQAETRTPFVRVSPLHSSTAKTRFLSNDSDLQRKLLIDKIKEFTFRFGKIPETTLEFYTLAKALGEGSYGKVYQGTSVLCSRAVAKKCYERTLIKARSAMDRISQEMEIVKLVSHENIIKTLEIFENQKFVFMVTEFADGGDFLSQMKRQGRFKEHSFLPLLRQILQALGYLHDRGILHRDIKLDNILLTKEGKIKLCDFGVSRRMSVNKQVFEHIGTPAYLAPEIIAGEGYSGFNADLWSLGVTCFIALTGQVPFKGERQEALQTSILTRKIEFPKDSGISEAMKKAICGMLEKSPSKRFGVGEVAKTLGFELVFDSELRQNTLDRQKIDVIKSYGFEEKMVVASLVAGVVNHATALYKML